jgi:hypothetical protein
MVVVKHSRLEIWSDHPFPTIHLVPELCARYADERGEIHTLVLSEQEALAIAAHAFRPEVVSAPPEAL